MVVVEIKKVSTKGEYSIHVNMKDGSNHSFYVCESYVINSEGKLIMKGGSVENGIKTIEFDEITIRG